MDIKCSFPKISDTHNLEYLTTSLEWKLYNIGVFWFGSLTRGLEPRVLSKLQSLLTPFYFSSLTFQNDKFILFQWAKRSCFQVLILLECSKILAPISLHYIINDMLANLFNSIYSYWSNYYRKIQKDR